MQTKVAINNKLLAGISYFIWPFSLIIVATTLKKDRFLRYHGYQALFFGICSTVSVMVVGAFLRVIPYFGELLFKGLMLIWLLLAVLLTVRCLLGEYFRVPLIYDLAQGNME